MAVPLSIEPKVSPVPPLEQGDHLSRAEFERRYAAMPELNKAELIEGVVHMPSPVRVEHHGAPHAAVMAWMGFYWLYTPGVRVADNSSTRLDSDNMPQPDAVLFIEPERGGNVRISADDYIEDAPELVAEVAASSVSIDLNEKLRAYRRNEVREYLVWRVDDLALDWFVLRHGQYERLHPGGDGICRSEAFPGLWLDPAALTHLDRSALLQNLQQGIASPEHAAFVVRLQQAGPRA